MPKLDYSARLPEPATWLRLFETTGWNEMYARSARALHAAIRASWRVVVARDGEEVVGAGRLVSDGVQYAVLFDLIVDPAWQGRGVGSEILRRLLQHADDAEIRDVLLFAARGTAGFYARHGFLPRPEDAPGMLRRT